MYMINLSVSVFSLKICNYVSLYCTSVGCTCFFFLCLWKIQRQKTVRQWKVPEAEGLRAVYRALALKVARESET